ncbi:hypothetical protein [Symmachiella dynata]|uniref:hypothetical protein n=1 Tax=Symmachiella dynata TaxID=2527995 RepID=UPI0030EB53B8
MNKKMWLSCQVSPGQFSGELSVKGDTFDSEGFSLFSQREFVVYAEGEAPPVNGWIEVAVLDTRDGLALVKLPGQTLENGTTITVSESELSTTASQQEA